jgi:hypothetical protein
MTAAEFSGQTSNEAIQLNLVMTPSRRALLRMAPWNMATKTGNLTYITSSPGTPENTSAATTLWSPGQPPPPWLYEYQYPVDCLRPGNVIPAQLTGFAGGVPITTAVTGGGVGYWRGPPVPYKVQTDRFYSINAATPAAGGTGYAVGDVLTLATTPAGSAPIGAPAQLVVSAVAAGAVTSVTVVNVVGNVTNSASGTFETIGGSYFAIQPGPVGVSATTGSGSGATFNLTWNGANQQRVIVTNQEFATLAYVADQTDPNVWDDQFTEAYVKIIAAQTCWALTGDGKKANGLIGEANQLTSLARVGDGNEGLTINDHTPDWIRTRGWGWNDTMQTGPFTGVDWGGLWGAYG